MTNYFSSSAVSGDQEETCWDTLLSLELVDRILEKLAEARKENGYQSQLSQVSICAAQFREGGKISFIPFLFKFRLAKKKKVRIRFLNFDLYTCFSLSISHGSFLSQG